MSESFLSKRVDRSAAPLAVGDVIAIVAVIAIGMEFGHGTLTGPVALIETAAPFLVGWAVTSVPIGAYSAGAAESPPEVGVTYVSRGVASTGMTPWVASSDSTPDAPPKSPRYPRQTRGTATTPASGS